MIKDYIDGISSYGKALSYLRRERVWVYVLIPCLIGVFLSGLSLWAILQFSESIGTWLSEKYQLDFGKELVDKASSWVAVLAMGSFSLLLFKYLILIISAPFMSPLSEKVESMVLGQKVRSGFSITQMITDLFRGLRINLRNIIRELFFTLVLLVLGFIPFLSPFTTIGIFLVQAYYAGFGNMDYTLERYFGVKKSIQFVRANKGLALGNGTIFMLALSIPIIGVLFILPLATIASTIETIKRVR